MAAEAALLVDPADETALSEGLRALAHDADLRGRLSASGLARAGEFSWQRTGTETVAAYRAALEAPAALPNG